MKNKESIEIALEEEKGYRDDPNYPMDEMHWANNQGWIEALEFVLDNEDERREQDAAKERLSKIMLTDKERNDIIGKAIQKTQRENQSFIDDEDSEPCGVCTCGVNCP